MADGANQRAWWFVLAGGLLEVVWTAGLKITGERFGNLTANPAARGGEATAASMALLITLMAILGSFFFLTRASYHLPVGTVYAVFAGIGSAGAVVLGMVGFREPVSFLRILLIAVLVFFIMGLKWTEGGRWEGRGAADGQRR